MPLPIGDPSGITAAQPTSSSRRASTGSSVVYGQHGEAVVDQRLGGRDELDGVGKQGPVVADHLELDPVGRERLPGELRGDDRVASGEAARGVRQHLDAGGRRGRRGSSRARRGRAGAARPCTARPRRPRAPAASTSWLAKPPVPRISRERNSRPAIWSGARSSALNRRDDLDRGAVARAPSRPSVRAAPPLRPPRPRRRGRRAARPRAARRRLATVAPSGSSRGSPLTITIMLMRAPVANRDADSSGASRRPPAGDRVDDDLRGDRRQQDAVAVMAGRPVQPLDGARAERGRVVGRARPQTCRELVDHRARRARARARSRRAAARCTGPAVTVVSRPRSSIVAPIT